VDIFIDFYGVDIFAIYGTASWKAAVFLLGEYDATNIFGRAAFLGFPTRNQRPGADVMILKKFRRNIWRKKLAFLVQNTAT
jgi:hypothetical protein